MRGGSRGGGRRGHPARRRSGPPALRDRRQRRVGRWPSVRRRDLDLGAAIRPRWPRCTVRGTRAERRQGSAGHGARGLSRTGRQAAAGRERRDGGLARQRRARHGRGRTRNRGDVVRAERARARRRRDAVRRHGGPTAASDRRRGGRLRRAAERGPQRSPTGGRSWSIRGGASPRPSASRPRSG